jgi:hypothetical protein
MRASRHELLHAVLADITVAAEHRCASLVLKPVSVARLDHRVIRPM